MNKKMEQMISRDTGVCIERICKMTWTELESLPYKLKEKPFCPDREMGLCLLELRNICRKMKYMIKCLLKHRKNI